PGVKTCKVALDGIFNIDADSGRTQLGIQLSSTTTDTPTPTDWTQFLGKVFVFDASGNGWVRGSGSSAPDAQVGQAVVVTGGQASTDDRPCVWYPGDGTRIGPDDEEDQGKQVTHAYAFAGHYDVMQV